jgi:hypothetical protein
VRSAAEFDAAIAVARGKISAATASPWYRGHRVGSWLLTPGLFRPGNDPRREHALYEEFRYKSGLLLPEKMNSWRLVYIMQHFGVPTRLVDWTDNLNTALYFALNGEANHPRIWLLNPFILTAITTKQSMQPPKAPKEEKFIYDVTDDESLDYYMRFLEEKDWPFSLPLPIYCRWDFPRIARQNGYFTIHGTTAFEEGPRLSRCLQSVQLEGIAVDELRQRLRDNNVDAFHIFHDLAGLAQSLKDKYGLI